MKNENWKMKNEKSKIKKIKNQKSKKKKKLRPCLGIIFTVIFLRLCFIKKDSPKLNFH
jgi:hypothetical protein